jgi:hypothetical protein
MLPTTSLPFLREPLIPTARLRASILTLLGPSPHLQNASTMARIGCLHDVQAQKFALVAYKARVVAVMNILEVGLPSIDGNKPIKGRRERNTSTTRKAIPAARASTATNGGGKVGSTGEERV